MNPESRSAPKWRHGKILDATTARRRGSHAAGILPLDAEVAEKMPAAKTCPSAPRKISREEPAASFEAVGMKWCTWMVPIGKPLAACKARQRMCEFGVPRRLPTTKFFVGLAYATCKSKVGGPLALPFSGSRRRTAFRGELSRSLRSAVTGLGTRYARSTQPVRHVCRCATRVAAAKLASMPIAATAIFCLRFRQFFSQSDYPGGIAAGMAVQNLVGRGSSSYPSAVLPTAVLGL